MDRAPAALTGRDPPPSRWFGFEDETEKDLIWKQAKNFRKASRAGCEDSSPERQEPGPGCQES